MSELITRAGNHILKAEAAKTGREIPQSFQITPENKWVIEKLDAYFSGNTQKAQALGVIPSRGIILRGNPGSGKTLIMQIFSLISREVDAYKPRHFKMVECDMCVERHNQDPARGIDLYRHKVLRDGMITGNENKRLEFCFDDLCHEPLAAPAYSVKLNVMESVIHSRYKHYKNHGNKFHATTNATDDQLLAFYGDRAFSRLNEMCNFITLGTGDSRDWRIDV